MSRSSLLRSHQSEARQHRVRACNNRSVSVQLHSAHNSVRELLHEALHRADGARELSQDAGATAVLSCRLTNAERVHHDRIESLSCGRGMSNVLSVRRIIRVGVQPIASTTDSLNQFLPPVSTSRSGEGDPVVRLLPVITCWTGVPLGCKHVAALRLLIFNKYLPRLGVPSEDRAHITDLRSIGTGLIDSSRTAILIVGQLPAHNASGICQHAAASPCAEIQRPMDFIFAAGVLLMPYRPDGVGGREGAEELRLHAPHVEADADVAAAARGTRQCNVSTENESQLLEKHCQDGATDRAGLALAQDVMTACTHPADRGVATQQVDRRSMVRACLARRGLNMTIDLPSAADSTRRTSDNPAHTSVSLNVRLRAAQSL